MSILLLALAFFVTATLYSSVGFGGGSTYNALLILGAVPLVAVPQVALACNIAVVAVGGWRFARGGHFDGKRIAPLVVLSVPAARLGGYLFVPAWLFVGLLALALLVGGLLMLWQPLWSSESAPAGPPSRAADMASGAGLGLLAGVTGIGGGIYLAPLLHLRGWGKSQQIASASAFFILVNSIAGLAGQLMKNGADASLALVRDYWPLLPAVLVGGLVGSSLGALRLSEKHLRIVTALLILYVGIRLGLRFPGEWARG